MTDVVGTATYDSPQKFQTRTRHFEQAPGWLLNEEAWLDRDYPLLEAWLVAGRQVGRISRLPLKRRMEKSFNAAFSSAASSR